MGAVVTLVVFQVHLKGGTPKPYTTQCKNKNTCWIGEHLDAYTIQKIGARESFIRITALPSVCSMFMLLYNRH